MAGFPTYDPTRRYEDWKSVFERKLARALSSFSLENLTGSTRDPVDIYLTDVSDRLVWWEERINNYGSEHKTEIFHDFQDSKSKLLIKLDDVDVSSNLKRKETRLGLYDRLSDLTRKLQSKIHPGHSDCPACVQFYEMDTKTVTEDVRKHVQWEFLVKVSGNSLKLNQDAVKLVDAADPDSIPVVILSVVGQPKSRKTSVMNEIIRHFEKLCRRGVSLPRCTFPLNSEDNPGHPDTHGQEGILLWQYPELVPRTDGTMTTWLFMDIWMEYPRVAVYNKLVDFCLSLSSTVVFSEPCDPNPDVYWQPCDSALSVAYTNFRNSLQLHFFLLTQDPLSEFYVMSDGFPWRDHHTAQFTNNFVSVTRAEAFLSPICKRLTSMFVPLREGEDKSPSPVKLESMRKMLIDCIQNPVKINNRTVNMSNIHYWLVQSILALNGGTLTPLIDGSNKIVSIKRDADDPEVIDPSRGKHYPSTVGYCGEKVYNESNPSPAHDPSPLYDLPLTDEDVEMIEAFGNQSISAFRGRERRQDLQLEDSIGDELVLSKSDNFYGQNEPSAHSFSKVLVSEEKGSYRALTKSKVPPEEPAGSKTATILFEISEYYVNNFKDIFGRIPDTQAYFLDAELMKHHDNLAQEILLAYPGDQARMGEIRTALTRELPQWFSEFRNLNEARRAEYDQLLYRTNAEVSYLLDYIAEQLRTELSTNPYNFAFKYHPEDFQTLYQKITYGIPERLKKPVEDVLVTARADLQTTMGRMNAMMHTYVQNLTKHSGDNICFDPRQFEDVHQESLMTAKSSTKYTDSGRKTLDDLCKKAVENLKNNFKEQNKFIYSKEEEISGDAHKHAVQKYRDFMEQKIQSNALSESGLRRLHQFATETISGLFLKALRDHETQPWIDQHEKLEKYLASLLAIYDKKRQNHLKKLDFAKKDGFCAGKTRYQDIMEKCLPETRVTDGIFVDYHNRAENQALEVMRAKSSDVPHQISKQWEEEFRVSLSDLRQRFVTENRNKQEKLRSYATAAQQAVAARQDPVQEPPIVHYQRNPYGIGILVSPKQVCVGVYVNQGVNFEDNVMSYEPSVITFTEGRVSIGEEASKDYDAGAHFCFNIFELLHTHKNIAVEVSIEGETIKIGLEETLSIFFHRIRMNTEIFLSQKIDSCYVAVTGLLSSGAKQMLKTSLTIAGFKENTLLPCTTAMAMSYILKSRDQGPASKTYRSSVLLAYATSKLVEVASADVTREEVRLQTLTGDTNVYRRFQPSFLDQVRIVTNFSDENELLLQKRLKHVLKSAMLPGKEYKTVVFCCGKGVEQPLHQALCNAFIKHCPSQSHIKFNLNNDILKVAAALDAIRKQHPDLLSTKVQFPEYRNISPHKMTVNCNNKPHRFVDFNSTTPIQEKSRVDGFGHAEISIQEIASDFHNEWEVGEYNLQIQSHQNSHLVLNLSQEGNLTVGTNPKGLPIATNARSLVGSQCQLILDSIKPLLDALEKRYGLKLPVEVDQRCKAAEGESTPVSMVSAQSRNSTDELLRSVGALVEKVKLELESSKTTSVTVRENIVLKIKKCEEFLKISAVEVKVRQLELAMNNLERAAKLIKP